MGITKATRVLLFFFLFFGGLYFGRDFLVPIIFAALLAMLLTPICMWLERRGLYRGLATTACVLLLIGVVIGIVALLSWQLAGISGDADQVIGQLNKIPGKLQEYIHTTVGIPVEQQRKMVNPDDITSQAGAKLAALANSAMAAVGTALLVLIYIFLFIYYRDHLRNFVLKFVPADDMERARRVMLSCSSVAQQYISGLGMMIGVLWIMYGIGFSIVGVKHALFFALLCGLLEMMPYVGNLTGTLLTAVMAFTQGGSNMALWVIAVYAVVQFTQTYLLEPLIVGARVSINPLCTIMVVILGEMVWGIPGMILAIPLLGIIKIICDNITWLQPFGYLIGEVRQRGTKL